MRKLLVVCGVLTACLLASLLASLGPAKLASGQANSQTIGWNVDCRYVDTKKVDPIVSPGRESGHSHEFIGAQVTKDSTNNSLRAEEHGRSNCRFDADNSGYWLPTLYKGAKRIPVRDGNAYYRAGPEVNPDSVQPYVPNTKVVAGDAHANGPQKGKVQWFCTRSSGGATRPYDLPPDCRDEGKYSRVLVQIRFPNCASAREDSADHQSHMAYGDYHNGRCPATHPRHVPSLRLSVVYDTANGSGTRLSNQDHGAYGMHADFMEAWQGDQLRTLIKRCIHAEKFCKL